MESSGANIKKLSPVQLVVIISVFVFVIELFLMVSLHSILPSISATAQVLLDSTLLVVLLSPLFYFFMFRPITFRINESRSIDEERARLSAIIEMTTDFVGTADIEGRLLYHNRAARKMMGIGVDEDISNIRIPDNHPDWANKIIIEEGIPAAIREGVWRGETALLSRDGREIPVSQVIIAHKAQDGTVEFLSTIIRDISDYKKVEDALRKSETSLENAQRIARMGNWEWDIEKNELFWSDEIYSIFGLIPQEFGATYEAFLNSIHPDDRELVKKIVNDAVYENIPYDIDHRILLPDGSERIVHEQAEVLFDDAGRAIKMNGTVQDITERKQTEESLRNSEERYKRLVESVTDYIYTVKVEKGFPVSTFHGIGCFAVTGYRSEEYEADPNLWYCMVYEEDRKAVVGQSADILSDKKVYPLEHRIIHRDGSIRWVKNTPVPKYNEQGRLIAYDGLISDITERKKLEEQLRHSQKMEIVGTFAGGIAHDFNNIITAMMGYGNLLKMEVKSDDPSSHHADQIVVLAEKAANLTQSLLAFSRKQVIHPKPTDLDEAIKKVEKILLRVIGEDIELKTMVAEKKSVVMADSGQIEQVLMNLCTNARDAMPGGGSLTIETDIVELDSDYTKKYGYGEPGHYYLISVADTGTGMDEKTMEKVFEPFFTTKEVGKGTGLGLSMVYGIIKQHNGYINVSSELGKGTRFDIYLPILKSSMVEKGESAGRVCLAGGGETILIADDELFLREVTKEVLEEFGYKVIVAVDGKDAIDKFMKHRDDIDLLVLDSVMPEKGGKQVYDELRKVRPDIKTVFLSGYAADLLRNKDIAGEGVPLISKPVSPDDLLKVIREVIDK